MKSTTKAIVVFLAFLGIGIGIGIHAQALRFEIAAGGGIGLPNGQLRSYNLLKTGKIASLNLCVSRPINEKWGLLGMIFSGFSVFPKNNLRIPSDCVSEPCVSYLTTLDSVNGRNQQFADIALELGGSYSILPNLKVKLAGGINWSCITMVETAASVQGDDQTIYMRYVPSPPIRSHRWTGLATVAMTQYFPIGEKLRLLVDLFSNVGLTPRMHIVGYKMTRRDFTFRPTFYGLRIGLAF